MRTTDPTRSPMADINFESQKFWANFMSYTKRVNCTMRQCWPNLALLLLLLLCFSQCLLDAASVGHQPTSPSPSPNPNPQTYGVIVDCGSSGTRANIYQWDTNLNYPNLLHDIAPMRDPATNRTVSKKFTPGLSSLADESADKMQLYIKQVADYVAEQVPSDRHAFTVIYMLATAGMRLLDEETQDKIMKEVKEYVAENYNFRKVTTSVISGTSEGMYRWISVNSKAKRFLDPAGNTNGLTKTYAVIEMGGASVQVVYQLRPGVSELISPTLHSDRLRQIYQDQKVEPQLSRHDNPANTYQLHSTTFLGFGGDSAHQAYLDLLIRKHYSNDFLTKFVRSSQRVYEHIRECVVCKAKGLKRIAGPSKKLLTILDPCAPKGYNSGDIKKPKRMLHTKEKTIGFIVDEEDEKAQATFSLRVIGQGNYNKCKRYVEEMMLVAKRERLNCKLDELCTMDLLGEPFIPFQTMDFVGVGDFYHTTSTMLDLDGLYQHDAIAQKTSQICNSSMRSLSKTYPDIAKNKNPKVSERIHTECFRAVWMDTFLVKGLLMPSDFNMFKTIEGINGDDPEWTLGAVLDKSLAIEEATENASGRR